ncbi:MAG: GNAT family N-acetyltransferase [Planctomycetes bacterium]|nr:GNAT family N-acetyltransferase [Planctomycetota bacterium]
MILQTFPPGYRLEAVRREHPRKDFHCGSDAVDDWLASKALQNQEKRLSVTKVLLERSGGIAGYYTLAVGQVDFSDLPAEITKRLPRRNLPVAVLAWLGVNKSVQGKGLGPLLLAHALRGCYEAGKIFAFVAVVVDAIDDSAKAFYKRWDFRELLGQPNRLFFSSKQLEAMMEVVA